MKSLRASIDIGSNSTLLLILDINTKEVILEKSTITSLGRDLDKNGVFLQLSMDDTFSALEDYAQECKKYQCNEIIITATEASRVAKNAPHFFERIENELGLKIQTITGEGEAYYTASGIVNMLENVKSRLLILDIGGASSELILVDPSPFKIISSISLPIGSVRVDDWIKDGVFKPKMDEIFSSSDLSAYSSKSVIGVAGTLTSLSLMFSGEIIFASDIINKHHLSLDEFNESANRIQLLDKSELAKKYPFLGKRAKTIQSGAICAQAILKQIDATSIKFSTYGLRYGTALTGAIDDTYLV